MIIEFNEFLDVFGRLKISDELTHITLKNIVSIYPEYLSKNNRIQYVKFFETFVAEVSGKLIIILALIKDKSEKKIVNCETISNLNNHNNIKQTLAKIHSVKIKNDSFKNFEKELKMIHSITELLKQRVKYLLLKFSIQLEQNISNNELISILGQYKIVLDEEKLSRMLKFLGLSEKHFCLLQIINKIKSN